MSNGITSRQYRWFMGIFIGLTVFFTHLASRTGFLVFKLTPSDPLLERAEICPTVRLRDGTLGASIVLSLSTKMKLILNGTWCTYKEKPTATNEIMIAKISVKNADTVSWYPSTADTCSVHKKKDQ